MPPHRFLVHFELKAFHLYVIFSSVSAFVNAFCFNLRFYHWLTCLIRTQYRNAKAFKVIKLWWNKVKYSSSHKKKCENINSRCFFLCYLLPRLLLLQHLVCYAYFAMFGRLSSSLGYFAPCAELRYGFSFFTHTRSSVICTLDGWLYVCLARSQSLDILF